MIPLRSRNGNQYLHRKSDDYRNRVKRKMRAYHTFIQAGVVAQGLLQYLAVAAAKLVGTPSAPGCEPFVPASRPANSSWQLRCARHFPNFSWLQQKAILSRNSSLSGRTQKICGLSAWLREQKDGLLSLKYTRKNSTIRSIY
jgi:hypothetical protein